MEKNLHRYFSKDIKMAKYMKTSSTSVIITEMHIGKHCEIA